jgi:multidrug efflux pump subunit AcrB
MNLIRFALKKPITILVLVAGLFFFGIKAVTYDKDRHLPKLDMPVIYVSHPFGGYTPIADGGIFREAVYQHIPVCKWHEKY